jgi:hypothetical protein
MSDNLEHKSGLINSLVSQPIGVILIVAVSLVAAWIAHGVAKYFYIDDPSGRELVPKLVFGLVLCIGFIVRQLFLKHLKSSKPKHTPKVPGGDYDW